MVKDNFETTATQVKLSTLCSKNVELSFTGDRISSDGGLLLLREVEKNVNIIGNISNCVSDNRDQRYIHHTIEELISQRVYQIAAGYEDCNDCDDLRKDMVLKTCVGRLPQS